MGSSALIEDTAADAILTVHWLPFFGGGGGGGCNTRVQPMSTDVTDTIH